MRTTVMQTLTTGVCEGVGQVFKIAAYQRKQVGVDNGGSGALVLAVFGQDVAAERDGEMGTGAAQDLGGAAFVLGIAKAVEETDCQTLGRGGGDFGGGEGQGILVQGGEDISVNVEPLHRPEAKIGLNERVRPLLVEGVEMWSILAADFDNINEAGGGQQCGTCAAAFKQRVGGDGRPMHELGVSGSV